jgi:hypothetical protein
MDISHLKTRFARAVKGKGADRQALTMESSRFQGPDIKSDIKAKYGFSGDLSALFADNQGAVVHKWHHYIPLYDRYFSPWRDKPLRFLEIGVSEGGSLQLWRSYFGPQATIFGIDINPDCARFDGQAGSVRIGSQTDPAFLNRVVAEMGGVDIVLDDGSHHMDHIRASLDVLFPKLAVGGVYFIEDLHSAYWPGFGGGYHHKNNIFNMLRKISDDMHHWYHGRPSHFPNFGPDIGALHLHDSIMVLEKAQSLPPVHSKVG